MEQELIFKISKSLEDISRTAGKILLNFFRENIEIKSKKGSELVTTADIKSEEYIIKELEERYPHIGILAEESNSKDVENNNIFLIDPLDGTHNFAYGIPFFCISIALQLEGEVVIGVVYDPIHEELFSCVKNCGAYLNGKTIRVSERIRLNDSILATGFPYIREFKDNSNIPEFSEFLMKTRGLRRLGSAALDLAYVACGRLDGFWEKYLNPWDIAAGGILVIEAGGKVTNFCSSNWDVKKDNIIASNGKIHNEMIEIIKEFL
jgi:myo-inositol-1(or 4)-monophosphatase